MKYVKKPVTVDAWSVTDLINRYMAYGVAGLPEPVAEAYEDGQIDFPSPFLGDFSIERLDVITLEGIMQANHGWMLIRGVRGEFYPCAGGIFRDTYTAANIIEEHVNDAVS